MALQRLPSPDAGGQGGEGGCGGGRGGGGASGTASLPDVARAEGQGTVVLQVAMEEGSQVSHAGSSPNRSSGTHAPALGRVSETAGGASVSGDRPGGGPGFGEAGLPLPTGPKQPSHKQGLGLTGGPSGGVDSVDLRVDVDECEAEESLLLLRDEGGGWMYVTPWWWGLYVLLRVSVAL